MPQPQPPELGTRNPWDAHERVTQAIDLILPLAETDLGIRGLVRAATGEMRTMQKNLDTEALMEADGYAATSAAMAPAVAASGGTYRAAP